MLRQLALFKRNASLQGITKYNLYHVHVQVITELKGKKIEHRQKQDYETIERSNHNIILPRFWPCTLQMTEGYADKKGWYVVL